jgi:hypothetical protein
MEKMKAKKINKANYEAFFLDFWEDSLTMDARKLLSEFLEANPDLHDEFLDFRDAAQIKLEADQGIIYPLKQNLRKPEVLPTKNINQRNFEDFFIGFVENDLDAGQQAEFKDFMNLNPQLLPELELYKKTILKPVNIVFEGKETLKQNDTGNLLRFWIYTTAVAAILLIGFIIINPFESNNTFTGMNRITVQRMVPEKPMPKIQPETNVELNAENIDNSAVAVVQQNMNPDTPVFPENEVSPETTETSHKGLMAEDYLAQDDYMLTKIDRGIATPALASLPVQGTEISPRTEMDGVFEYLMLRDMMLAEEDQKKPGAVERVFANLGNLVFGSGDEENPSLLGQIADAGRERINEISEDGPKLETIESEESKATYFAINENFKIRISKSNKTNEPHQNRN